MLASVFHLCVQYVALLHQKLDTSVQTVLLSSVHTLFLLCYAVLCCRASPDLACMQRADACRLRWARKRCILRRCFTAVNENTANSGVCRRENLNCGNTTILYKHMKNWGKVLFFPERPAREPKRGGGKSLRQAQFQNVKTCVLLSWLITVESKNDFILFSKCF